MKNSTNTTDHEAQEGKAIRPEGYNEQRDCTVRAIQHALGISYETAHAKLKERGRKDGHKFVLQKHCASVVRELGHNAVCVKRSGSVGKLRAEWKHAGNLIVRVRGHAFAILNGEYQPGEKNLDAHRVKHAWLIDPAD